LDFNQTVNSYSMIYCRSYASLNPIKAPADAAPPANDQERRQCGYPD